eukprot:gene14153-15631_t
MVFFPDLRIDSIGLIFSAFVVVLTLLVRVFRLRDDDEKPKVLFKGGKFCKDILERCTILQERYHPTFLWGRSGHIQTLIHAAIGRFGSRDHLRSELCTLEASDGATVSYNLFNQRISLGRKVQSEHNVVLIVPGIANHCKTVYVESFTSLLLENGFDVVVYNHLGAFPKTKLTSQRIFTYGCTQDFQLVVDDVLEKYNHRKIFGIGFSMGANVLLKYLGEVPERQNNFLCAVSVCQGYNILKAAPLLNEWKGMRRFYNWAISRNMKRVLLSQHKSKLMEFEKKDNSLRFDWRRISSSLSLQEIDEAATRHFTKYKSLEEFYEKSSSATYMHQLKLPVLMLNAADDPIIPEDLFEAPMKLIGVTQLPSAEAYRMRHVASYQIERMPNTGLYHWYCRNMPQVEGFTYKRRMAKFEGMSNCDNVYV